MGQLFTLATHCINDKSFYKSNCGSGKQIQKKLYDSYYYGNQYERSYNIVSSTILPKGDDNWLILCDLNQQDKNNKIIRPKVELTIKFDDEPPIHISYRIKTTNLKKEIGSVVLTKKTFLKLIKNVHYTFEYEIFEHKYEYLIMCGTIIEPITDEQCDGLIEAFITNTLKLSQEADQDKINERLKKYENEKA